MPSKWAAYAKKASLKESNEDVILTMSIQDTVSKQSSQCDISPWLVLTFLREHPKLAEELCYSCIKSSSSSYSLDVLAQRYTAGQKHWEESPQPSESDLESVREGEYREIGQTQQPNGTPTFTKGSLLEMCISLPPYLQEISCFQVHRVFFDLIMLSEVSETCRIILDSSSIDEIARACKDCLAAHHLWLTTSR